MEDEMKMIAKMSLILMILLMILSVTMFAQTVAEPPSNYDEPDAGTEQNPYLIANLANLRWLSETVTHFGSVSGPNTYFLQTADIDASETIGWNDGRGFKPIGGIVGGLWTDYTFFKGNYDGTNFIISNLYLNYDDPMGLLHNSFPGLFSGIVISTIKNIHLPNVNFTILKCFSQSNPPIGVLGSLVSDSSIENISISGNIILNLNGLNSWPMVGGFFGFSSATTIEKCYSTLTIIDFYDNTYIGGLVGQAVSGTVLGNSFFHGNISNTNVHRAHGALVYHLNSSMMQFCYSTNKEFMPIIFSIARTIMNSSSVLNTLWDMDRFGNTSPFVISGTGHTVENTFGFSTVDMKMATTYINNGWDFHEVWTIHPEVNDGYPYFQSWVINFGSLEGTIHSTEGEAIPNVELYINDIAFAVSYSDYNGRYSLPQLVAGEKILRAVRDGYEEYISEIIEIEEFEMTNFNFVMTPIVKDKDISDTPEVFRVIGNFPNPFGKETEIVFNISPSQRSQESRSHISIEIFNVKGQFIKEIVKRGLKEGEQSVVWDGKDMNGNVVPNGIYFYRIQTGNFISTKKMMYMR